MKKIAPLLALILLLTACGQAADPAPITEIIANITLPEGYAYTEISDGSCSIVRGEVLAGGVSRPDIQVKSLEELAKDKYLPYLNSLAPEPLMLEFIAMKLDPCIAISLKITDPETDAVSNQMHYLFLKDGQCYDLWLDRDTVEAEELDAIKKQIG